MDSSIMKPKKLANIFPVQETVILFGFAIAIPVKESANVWKVLCGAIFEVITLVCDSEVARTGCQEYHDIVHPHLPAPLRREERVTQ